MAGIGGERRLQWIAHALAPLREELDKRSFRRLVSALALCMGAEAFVVLRDLCTLGPGEAEGTLRWAAHTLLTAAIDEGGHLAGGFRELVTVTCLLLGCVYAGGS